MILTIEDETSSLQVVIFESVLNKLSDMPKEGMGIIYVLEKN